MYSVSSNLNGFIYQSVDVTVNGMDKNLLFVQYGKYAKLVIFTPEKSYKTLITLLYEPDCTKIVTF